MVIIDLELKKLVKVDRDLFVLSTISWKLTNFFTLIHEFQRWLCHHGWGLSWFYNTLGTSTLYIHSWSNLCEWNVANRLCNMKHTWNSVQITHGYVVWGYCEHNFWQWNHVPARVSYCGLTNILWTLLVWCYTLTKRPKN